MSQAAHRRLHADELRLHADLGKITRSWANLHEHLASVLARTLECDQAIANSMWHTLQSDLSQRKLLEAAIKARIEVFEKAVHMQADLENKMLFLKNRNRLGYLTNISGR